MSERLDIDKQACALSVLEQFDAFQRKNEHCDFKVKIDGEEIHVYRGILAAGSDYFKGMLSHDTLENQLGVVELKSVDVESVRKCIDFLYNRDVLVSAEGYGNLMHTAYLLLYFNCTSCVMRLRPFMVNDLEHHHFLRQNGFLNFTTVKFWGKSVTNLLWKISLILPHTANFFN